MRTVQENTNNKYLSEEVCNEEKQRRIKDTNAPINTTNESVGIQNPMVHS